MSSSSAAQAAMALWVAQAVDLLRQHPYQVWHYGDSVAMEALLAAADALDDRTSEAYLRGITLGWSRRSLPIREIDVTAPGMVLVELSRRDGWDWLLPSVQALVEGIQGLRHVHGAVVSFERSPLLRPYGGGRLDALGESLLMDPGAGVFVDCMHFVPPLLARAGTVWGDEALRDAGVSEATAMIELLREDDGLFAHFWLEKTGQRYGQGWGRGQGWALLGLIDVIESIPVSHPQRDHLLGVVSSTLTAMSHYQRSNGHWTTPVHQADAPLETSTAAFVALAVTRLERLGEASEGDRVMGARAWAAAVTSATKGGLLGGVSHAVWASTELSHYRHVPQSDFAPWGQAPMVLAAIERDLGVNYEHP